MKQQRKINNANHIKLFILLISIILTWYFVPMSETFVCDEDYKCRIEKNYIFNIQHSKMIQVDKNSALTYKTKFKRRGRRFSIGGEHRLYPILINNNKKHNLFTYYYLYDQDRQVCILNFENVIEEFSRYIDYPKIGFRINSLADGFWAILWPILVLIGYPLLYFTNKNK